MGNEVMSSWSKGPVVDLVATVDGRWAELGRDLSDRELSRVEGVISMGRMMEPSRSGKGEAELRVEQPSGVYQAMVFEGQIICIDLPRSGLGAADFRQRARRSYEWARKQWFEPGMSDEQTSARDDMVPTLEDTPFLSMDEVDQIPLETGSHRPATSDEGTSKEAVYWDEVGSFIQDCSEVLKQRLGATVVANYWRQALRDQEVSELKMRISGDIDIYSPSKRLRQADREALQAAIDQWTDRCRRVVPDWESLRQDIDDPPWEETQETTPRPFFEL